MSTATGRMMTRSPLPLTPAATVVLADAVALATTQGAAETEVSHVLTALARAVSDSRAGRLRRVLAGLNVDLSGLAGSNPAQRIVGDLVGLSGHTRALVGTAAEMAEMTGEAEAGTPHLLAAAVDLGYVTRLSELGVTADVLLARAAEVSSASDDSRASRPEPVAATSLLSATPSPADLTRRTTGRRSAMFARLLGSVLPSGKRTGTSLGRKRIRGYVAGLVIEYVAGYAAILALIVHVLEHGSFWMLALLVLMGSTSTTTSVTVLLLVRLPVVVLAPTLVGVLVTVSFGGALLAVRAMTWMLRVDRGDPALSATAVWRGYWTQAGQMIKERFANGSDSAP